MKHAKEISLSFVSDELLQQINLLLQSQNRTNFICAYLTHDMLLSLAYDNYLSRPQTQLLLELIPTLARTLAQYSMQLDPKRLQMAQTLAEKIKLPSQQLILHNLLAELLQNADANITEVLEKEHAQLAARFLKHEAMIESLRQYNQAYRVAAQLEKDSLESQQQKLNELEARYLFYQAEPIVLEQCNLARQHSVEKFELVFQSITRLCDRLVALQNYQPALLLYHTVLTNYLTQKEAYQAANFDKTKLLTAVKNLHEQLFNSQEKLEFQLDWLHYRNQLTNSRNTIIKQQNKSTRDIQIFITQSFQKLLSQMLQDAIQILGPAPYSFAFIGFGSYSRQEMLPYSDLEFALLIEKHSELAERYFKTLLKLLHFKVESLDESDEKHLGFHLDNGIQPIKDDLFYGSPDKIVVTLFDPKKCDLEALGIHLLSALQSRLIYGDTQLWEAFQKAVHNHLHQPYSGTNQSAHRQIALLLIAKNLSEHQHLNKSQKDVFFIKEYFSKYLQGYIILLSLYYNIFPENCDNALLQFAERNILHADFIKLYQQVLQDIVNLRFKLHCYYGEAEDAVLPPQSKPLLHASGKPIYILTDKEYSILLVAELCILQPLHYAFQSRLQESALNQLNHPWQSFIQHILKSNILLQDISQQDKIKKRLINPITPVYQILYRSLAINISNQQLENIDTIGIVTQSLLYYLFYIKATPQQHCDYYDQLPETLRSIYLAYMENILGTSLENPILQQLYHHPNLDGFRPIMKRRKQAWYQALALLFQANISTSDIQHAKQEDKAIVVACALSQPDNFTLRQYLFKPIVEKQLFKAKGIFKNKPDKQAGRHTVLPIVIDEQHIFWAKIYPEQPGTEYAISQLAERLSDGGTPQNFLIKICCDNQSHAVQLFSHVPGEASLEQVIKITPQLLARIDPKSFVQTLLRVLLINPEDDKGDDYFLVPIQQGGEHNEKYYSLVRIDNERAYYQPDETSKSILKSSRMLQVKSILYCLDQMQIPLTGEVIATCIEDFLRIQPYLFIQSLLQDLQLTHQYYQHLFSEEELKHHFDLHMPSPSLLTVALAEGWAKEIFNRLNSLQTVLKLAKKNNLPLKGMDLLKIVQPQLAKYYEEAFQKLPIQVGKPQLALSRFELVTQGLYEKTSEGYSQSKMPSVQAISQSLRLKQTLTTTDVLAIVKGERFSPKQALDELQSLQAIRLPDIQKQLLQGEYGSVEIFQQLTMRHQLAIIKAISRALMQNPQAYSQEQQCWMLKAIVGIPFHRLCLTAFKEVLTDAFLKPILQGATKHIIDIDLSECWQLTSASVAAIGQFCPNLRRLVLKNIINIKTYQTEKLSKITDLPTTTAKDTVKKIIPKPNLSNKFIYRLTIFNNYYLENLNKLIVINDVFFPNLLELDISGCKSLSVLTLKAPRLQRLAAADCEKLTYININSEKLQDLDLTSCITLTEEQLTSISPKFLSLTQLHLNGCLQLRHILFREKYPFLLNIPLNDCTTAWIQNFAHILEEIFEKYKEFPMTEVTQLISKTLNSWLLNIRNECIPGLINALRDIDDDVRQAVVEALEQVGLISQIAINKLFNILEDANKVFQDFLDAHTYEEIALHEATASTLGQLGQTSTEIIAALLSALKNKNWYVREGAVKALQKSKYCSPEVIAALLTASKDTHKDVREAVAHALGQLGQVSVEIISALLISLEDNNKDVRQAAAHALGQLGQASAKVVSALLTSLRDTKRDIRQVSAQAIGQLAQISSVAITALFTALKDFVEEDADDIVEQTLMTLRQASPEVISTLLSGLRDSNKYVCQLAVLALGQLNYTSSEIITTLSIILKDADKDLSQAAAKTLGQLGHSSPLTIITLCTALKDADWRVRLRTVIALKQQKPPTPEIATALLTTLKDSNAEVRNKTASALGEIGHTSPEVITALLNMLKDSSTPVRLATMQALGQLGKTSSKVTIALLAELKNSDAKIRSRIVKTLEQTDRASPEVIAALLNALKDPSVTVWHATIQALKQLTVSPNLVTTLLASLEDADWRVRLGVVAVLEQLKQSSPEIIDALLTALKDSDTEVRRRATKALGQIGHASSDVIAALQKVMQDRRVPQEDAALALGQLRTISSNVMKILSKTVTNNTDNQIRKSVAKTLGQLGNIKTFKLILENCFSTLSGQLPQPRQETQISFSQYQSLNFFTDKNNDSNNQFTNDSKQEVEEETQPQIKISTDVSLT